MKIKLLIFSNISSSVNYFKEVRNNKDYIIGKRGIKRINSHKK